MVEGCYLMRNRFRAQEVWERMGFDVAPVTVVPVLLLAAGCAAVILAGNLLASVPAAVAARTPGAGMLRTE